MNGWGDTFGDEPYKSGSTWTHKPGQWLGTSEVALRDQLAAVKIELKYARKWQEEVCDLLGYDGTDADDRGEVLNWLPFWLGETAAEKQELRRYDAKFAMLKKLVEGWEAKGVPGPDSVLLSLQMLVDGEI